MPRQCVRPAATILSRQAHLRCEHARPGAAASDRQPIGQGTGLGLSMIHGFVWQSDGQVRICSEVAQSTAVGRYLRRQAGEADHAGAPSDRADAPRAEQGETVLVADDQPAVRMLATEMLEGLGHIALEVADDAWLHILRSDARIDLLVTGAGPPAT